MNAINPINSITFQRRIKKTKREDSREYKTNSIEKQDSFTKKEKRTNIFSKITKFFSLVSVLFVGIFLGKNMAKDNNNTIKSDNSSKQNNITEPIKNNNTEKIDNIDVETIEDNNTENIKNEIATAETSDDNASKKIEDIKVKSTEIINESKKIIQESEDIKKDAEKEYEDAIDELDELDEIIDSTHIKYKEKIINRILGRSTINPYNTRCVQNKNHDFISLRDGRKLAYRNTSNRNELELSEYGPKGNLLRTVVFNHFNEDIDHIKKYNTTENSDKDIKQANEIIQTGMNNDYSSFELDNSNGEKVTFLESEFNNCKIAEISSENNEIIKLIDFNCLTGEINYIENPKEDMTYDQIELYNYKIILSKGVSDKDAYKEKVYTFDGDKLISAEKGWKRTPDNVFETEKEFKYTNNKISKYLENSASRYLDTSIDKIYTFDQNQIQDYKSNVHTGINDRITSYDEGIIFENGVISQYSKGYSNIDDDPKYEKDILINNDQK